MNKLKRVFEVCELLSAIAIVFNTFVLLLIQNTLTFEEQPNFAPTPKSSIGTIIQYYPLIKYTYIGCGVILLICGLYRLLKLLKEKNEKCMK